MWCLAVLCLGIVIAGPATGAVDVLRIATGLTAPVDIAHAGDGSRRLFVVEQAGRVRIVRDGQVMARSFLDIAPLVLSGGERGLLGIAFHPQYARNRRVFVNYTRVPEGDTVIAEYRASDDPDLADHMSARVLLVIPQPFANHNGGDLHFGPDGRLYIAMGDGGSANDPGDRAQDPGTLLGKLLRIDVDAATPYAIPPDNPLANGGGRPEIFALGLRNPWKFAFDRADGALVIADVGQNEREEIDYIPFADARGANFGWRVLEGTRCTGLNGAAGCSDPRNVAPVLEYSHAEGCSVTGGHVYRGTEVPELGGRYVYADLCSGRMWTAVVRRSGPWTAELLRTHESITTFGEDEAGELYFADSRRGELYRFVSTASPRSLVIEYYHAGFDHYLMTVDRDEIAALDAGVFSGWARTAQAFQVNPGAAPGVSPVCRFYLPPGSGDSHFYSASPAECDEVAARFPSFVLESATAMWATLPDADTGACAAPLVPVYRLWNRRPDTNHRYTTSLAIREQMVVRGYAPEGYGPVGVAMCAQP